jgi:hypothetical protein
MESVITCPHCGQTPRAQHSNRRAGICDGIRSGKLKPFFVSASSVAAYDKDGNKVVYGEDSSVRSQHANATLELS